MNLLKKLLFGAVALILLVLAAVAVNQDPVQLRFINWTTPAWSVFWWLLAAFTLGGIMGFILAYLTTFKTHMERRRLQRSVKEQASEIQRLKTVSTDAVPDA